MPHASYSSLHFQTKQKPSLRELPIGTLLDTTQFALATLESTVYIAMKAKDPRQAKVNDLTETLLILNDHILSITELPSVLYFILLYIQRK